MQSSPSEQENERRGESKWVSQDCKISLENSICICKIEKRTSTVPLCWAWKYWLSSHKSGLLLLIGKSKTGSNFVFSNLSLSFWLFISLCFSLPYHTFLVILVLILFDSVRLHTMYLFTFGCPQNKNREKWQLGFNSSSESSRYQKHSKTLFKPFVTNYWLYLQWICWESQNGAGIWRWTTFTSNCSNTRPEAW